MRTGVLVCGSFLGLLTARVSRAFAEAFESPLATLILAPAAANPTEAAVASGALDQDFQAFNYRDARRRDGPFWLRLTAD